MLLRSSSTPMLNSLINESPHHHHNNNHHPLISCNLSSPFSDSSPSSSAGVRRTLSDGNLHSLLSDHNHDSSSCSRRSNPMLESIPSLSVYNSKLPQNLEEEEEEEDEKDEDQEGLGIEREFSFSRGKQGPLFLARGLGIDRVASGMMLVGGGDGGGCGEMVEMEMYYKKMVDEDPSNALVLRNYAKFLYEIKSDLPKAEEYYSRAILAEPGDGEILSQYAKLVWELHKDEERACTYFEQAIQASPHDSHVAAAYASFLWETEEDEEEGVNEFNGAQVSHGTLTPATALEMV